MASFGAARAVDAHLLLLAVGEAHEHLVQLEQEVAVPVVEPQAQLAAHAVRPRDLGQRDPASSGACSGVPWRAGAAEVAARRRSVDDVEVRAPPQLGRRRR